MTSDLTNTLSAPNFPSPTSLERRADFAIHTIGLVGVGVGSVFVVRAAFDTGPFALVIAAWTYALAVLASIGVSFAYHLLPRHDARARLRRWDHAAIYTSIAGTFSPLLVKAGTASGMAMLAAVWLLAIMGVVFKLSGDHGDSRWSLVSYLGLGGFTFLALPDVWTQLPPITTYAVAAGAGFYAIGTAFYRKRGMRYRYPIWHAWGTLGGLCFFVAVWNAVTG
ncbi:MAG: hemolysin III family protein [Pseudomonadota bacterium]